jgi:hypothetical protein
MNKMKGTKQRGHWGQDVQAIVLILEPIKPLVVHEVNFNTHQKTLIPLYPNI